MKNTQSAFGRTQASWLVSDIIGRMRSQQADRRRRVAVRTTWPLGATLT